MPTTPALTAYLEGSCSLDPDFVRLRRKHFDPETLWRKLRAGGDGSGLGAGWFAVSRSRVKGLLPVRWLSGAFGWETRPFTGGPAAFTEPREWAAWLDALAKERGWDAAQLNGLDQLEVAALQIACRERGWTMEDHEFPIRVIDGFATAAEYFADRGSSTQKSRRRARKLADERGLRAATEGELAWRDIEKLLDAKEIGGDDYTKSPAFRAFFKELRETWLKPGRLVEAALFDGTRPVGYTSAFETGGTLHVYQTAYDPAYRDLSPGALTMDSVIERGFARKPRLFDFMGSYPYLVSFAPAALPLRRAVVHARTPVGRVLSLLSRRGD